VGGGEPEDRNGELGARDQAMRPGLDGTGHGEPGRVTGNRDWAGRGTGTGRVTGNRGWTGHGEPERDTGNRDWVGQRGLEHWELEPATEHRGLEHRGLQPAMEHREMDQTSTETQRPGPGGPSASPGEEGYPPPTKRQPQEPSGAARADGSTAGRRAESREGRPMGTSDGTNAQHSVLGPFSLVGSFCYG